MDKSADPLTYVVMEDYLPSAFEAVNPALLSQIPGGRESETADAGNRWFYWNGWVSTVNSEGPGALFRRFLVGRPLYGALPGAVTKSGSVIAPSAKAELMYKPETYGLSIPQKLTVSAGK